MKILLSTIALMATLSCVQGWPNIPPIPERHPGWSEGKNRLLINFELFEDLLCDGCAMLRPEFERFLNMTYLGLPVRDQIQVNYAFLALPYHHGSWIAQRLLPYIIDQCLSTPKQCQYKQYVAYTLNNRDSFLDATSTTFDDLTTWWINTCNQQYNWPVSDLRSVYDRSKADAHNSEQRARNMWKYAADQGVFATPTAFVNGIRL